MITNLPTGWTPTRLGDVVMLNPRGGDDAPADDAVVSFVPMAAVGEATGRAEINQTRLWGDVRRGYTPMRDGDVVFAKITPCMENGKVALLGGMSNGRGAGSTELLVLRPSSAVDARYLLHYLLQEKIRRDARAVMRGAAGQLRVPTSFLASLLLPLPPLAEQCRIASALEEHLSALDAALAGLARARANVQRFIDSTIATLVHPRAEWPIASLRDLGVLKGGVTKGQKRRAGEITRAVSYLRVANVQRGRLDLRDVRLIDATEREIVELRLLPGDVLFNEGGDRDKLGRGWVWNGERDECIHQNHVFRARLDRSRIEPRFVSHFANSHGQRYFFDEGKQTTNLASISMTKLGALPVPVPPISEQRSILSSIDERLSVAERTAADINLQLARAARMRQSILQRAFSGHLVAQDPNDESALDMLDRLRAGANLRPTTAPRGRGLPRTTPTR